MSEDTFNLFLHHMYGCKIELVEVTELSTLAELHRIASQFGQVELEKEVKERLGWLLEKDASRGPVALVEVNILLARYKVEELLTLVEEKLKAIEVGEEDLAGLLAIVNQGGPQSKVRNKIGKASKNYYVHFEDSSWYAINMIIFVKDGRGDGCPIPGQALPDHEATGCFCCRQEQGVAC